jgi:uncharacterized membrane protein
MIQSILWLFMITFVPAIELRGSIPLGFFNQSISSNLNWPWVVLVCLVANCLIGWIVFWILGPMFKFIRKWGWFDRKVWPVLEKTQNRLHPYVEKYGEMGVAIFIGVPLPGTGVYSGALGAYLLGLDRKKFSVANVLGVLIAGTIVTAICLLIHYGLLAENSWITRLFIKSQS